MGEFLNLIEALNHLDFADVNNVKRFVNEVKRKIEKINDNVKIGYLYRSIGLDLLLIYRPQLCPVEPSVKDFAIPSTINPYKRDGILNYS